MIEFKILLNSDYNFPLRLFRRHWDGEEIQRTEEEPERVKKMEGSKGEARKTEKQISFVSIFVLFCFFNENVCN